MKKFVGLFRPLRFEDLDKTAELLLKYPAADAYDILNDILRTTIKGKEGRRKVINNLMRVWGNGKKTPTDLQKKVMQHYTTCSPSEKIVLQILMVHLAFPFFAEAVSIVGKYLRMSDSLRSRTLMNEITNIYGNTETVEKGVISVLGSLVNWGILTTDKQGYYEYHGKSFDITYDIEKDTLIQSLFIHADAEYVSLEIINNYSGFFMLNYHINHGYIQNANFELVSELSNIFVKNK